MIIKVFEEGFGTRLFGDFYPDWISMDLAPRDGTVILLKHDNVYPTIGWFDTTKECWQEVWQHNWGFVNQPNGWLPLPDVREKNDNPQNSPEIRR